MTIIDAPPSTVLSPAFFDEVVYLLRRLVVHGAEQEMLFRVMDVASHARDKSTTVKSCTCCQH
jgi:hypothetical protein